MEWLTRNLDLCSTAARASTPPSCRSRFNYWLWDNPDTIRSPDALFVYGGLQGAFPQPDSTSHITS